MNLVEHTSDDHKLENYVYRAKSREDKDEEKLEYSTFIVRKLLLLPMQKEETQWHQLFRTRCWVFNKFLDLVIDSGDS